MKKGKFKLASILAFGLLLSTAIFLCVGTIIPAIATLIEVSEGASFIVEEDGHTYRCYHLEQEGTTVPGVAIAWGELPENTPDEGLTIPGEVHHGDDTYTVRAIAKHGFRFCDFKYVTVPQSVELIEEEAFAYCTQLKNFKIPYKVDKISPSTFLDCRSLEMIKYSDAVGSDSSTNNVIESIGDHAFDSCVSLKSFYCPRKVTYFGESSFKNCRTLVNFFFPSIIKENNVITNYITVRPYAFADCKALSFIYFETNMQEIDDYAFVDVNSTCGIKYTGNSTPTFKRDGVTQSHWRDFVIATNNSKQIPIETKHATIMMDDHYPCLRYSVENKVVKLDAAQNRETQIDVIPASEVADEGEYAVIYRFDTPSEDVPGCFDVDTGDLIIPDTIDGYTVKVIAPNAFANNPYITSVTFNQHLVQIRNKAFYNSTEIKSLDFITNHCEKLIEVSYTIFTDYNGGQPNHYIEELDLPDSIQFIGGYAFGYLQNVKSLHLPNSLRAMDDCAFYRLGYDITDASEATIDLVFPKSLNDADAVLANFKHLQKGSYKHDNYTRFYAIGKYAFTDAKTIRTATMEDDPAHANDMSYTTSLYSNVFNGASNLIRFKANKNLQYLGKDSFKYCTGLREVFLTTAKSCAVSDPYPWCINEENGSYGGTLFFGSVPDCICYIDGPHAPGILETMSLDNENGDAQLNSFWNAETTGSYGNEIKGSTDLVRSHIPTYYNVDFDNGVKYWKPDTKTFLPNPPLTLDQYKAGFLTFVKNDDTGKYAVIKYNFDMTSETGYGMIDLTAVQGISDGTHNDLTIIGNEAFSRNGSMSGDNPNKKREPGCYFILPDTITEIGARAFYRNTSTDKDAVKNNARYGARVVTYKSGDKIIGPDGSSLLTQTQFNTYITTLESNLDVNKEGYCVIPPNVTSIGIDCFYNNIFKDIYLNSSLTYLGSGAFYNHPQGSDVRSKITSIHISGNSYFTTSDNAGLYYTGGGNAKKMLIYQVSNVTGTLTIEENTKAIGMMAVANTKYTKINLNTGLLAIYGGAFYKNMSLTEVTGTEDLRYIGAMENPMNPDVNIDDEYEEIFDSTVAAHLSNADYRDYLWEPRGQIQSLYNAFSNCNNMTTFNFKVMTNITKIGPSAFNGCGKLKLMTGTDTYVYKQYDASTNTSTTITGRSADNENVLDLSNASKLRVINRDAFANCGTIKFIHLPDNRGSASESPMNIGFDPEAKLFDSSKGAIVSNSKGHRILVGETAEYAHHDFGKGHNAQNHYAANCFGSVGSGTNDNKVYYHVANASDIPTDDATSIKYWTQDANGNYILINSANDARKYFGVA